MTSENEQSITITFDSFMCFIEEISRLGFEFKRIDEIVHNRETCIFLSFDDIFESAFEYAIPFLEKKKIPYACFISPGLLNKKPYITEEQLDALSTLSNCYIGAHSFMHRKPRELSDDDMSLDFKNAKEYLESRTKKEIKIMAYPYGSRSACPQRVKKNAQKAGFDYAFSSYSFVATEYDIVNNPLFIPRININQINYNAIYQRLKESINA